jgi:hypothetical protein
MKFYLIIIFVTSFLKLNAQPPRTKNSDLLQSMIKTFWSIDTCGKKGYKEKIVSLILNAKDSNSILLGKDTNDIIYLFGMPDTRYLDDNGYIIYQYYCMLLQDKNGECYHPYQLEGEGMQIVFKGPNYKVIDCNGFIE